MQLPLTLHTKVVPSVLLRSSPWVVPFLVAPLVVLEEWTKVMASSLPPDKTVDFSLVLQSPLVGMALVESL